ncbi:dUTP pyrophosphatase [Pantoea phage Phynn]|nr:dUTP pyrophosphatase [Pantoea phage Phynn]
MTIDKQPVFNECAGLVNDKDLAMVEEKLAQLTASGGNTLQYMLNLQAQAQNHLSDKLNWVPRPDELKTCGQILDWLKQQDDSIADETRELYTALGGMSNGAKDASGVFKPWKANHQDKRAMPFTDLSPTDRLEAQFELIDQFHFFLCKFLALGMDADTIFKLYALKQAENIRRWNNGY